MNLNLFIEVILQIIFIFGLLFLDFIVDLFFKRTSSKVEWKNKLIYTVYHRSTWISLFILNLLIIQYFPRLTGDKFLPNTFIWNNSILQLLVIFYFLYTLEDKSAVYFNSGFSITIGFYYMFICQFQIKESITIILTVFWISITGEIIYRNREKWIDKEWIYLLSCIFFILSWGTLTYYSTDLSYSEKWMSSFPLIIIYFVVHIYSIHLINKIVRQLWINYSRNVHEANTDALTKIGNRNAFEKTFQEVFERYKTVEQPLSFAMFDIDHFKKVNDTYGHKAGDAVLKRVAKEAVDTLIRKNSGGQVFRIGGEEFGIIFRGKQGWRAKNIMEEIAHNISNTIVDYDNNKLSVNVSVGVSELTKACKTKDDLYKRVDSYLYNSKENGRKSITFEGLLEKYK